MNNLLLIEKLGIAQIKNLQYNENFDLNEEVYEMSLYGGWGQFIKDSIKYLVKIKGLKDDDEIIMDLIHPTGFLSIYKNNDIYELNLAAKGIKTVTYKTKKAADVIVKVIQVIKDQIIVGRKELKNQYK